MSLLNVSVEEQLRIITSGTDTIVPVEGLKKKLEQGRPLNIKLGVDPTSPDLHLGHAVPLQKMRQFQDLGHNVTLIIGNGTAFIGDPSGKNSTRPQLSHEQIEFNAQTYVEQAMKVLDPAKTKIVHNGDWILTMDLGKLLEIASKFTVARILERDDFTKRYTSHTPIALHEFLYPVMQAYDSVMINADVEMGGRDQLFNLLAGREPDDMFGKIMSIPDNLIVRYYRLATRVDVHEIDAIEADLAAGTGDPNALKRRLARIIIDNYHTPGDGEKAEEAFNRVHRNHEVPEDVEEFACDLSGEVYLPGLLQEIGFAASAGEGRRLIDGGGVKVDGEALPAKSYNVPGSDLAGRVLQAGKRRFARIQAR